VPCALDFVQLYLAMGEQQMSTGGAWRTASCLTLAGPFRRIHPQCGERRGCCGLPQSGRDLVLSSRRTRGMKCMCDAALSDARRYPDLAHLRGE